MFQDWLKGLRKYLVGSCAALLVSTGAARAQNKDAELRALTEQLKQQGQQLQELKKQLDAQQTYPTAAGADGGKSGKPPLDTDAVKKIVGDYLKDNPGAGLPSGVQTGYKWGQGFSIASPPNPKYVKWDDESKIPFELRLKGRVQLDYYGYNVTDSTNHQTNRPAATTNGNARLPNFSQLEVKRLRLIWEGCAFTPNLRYNFTLDGNTRGLGGFQNNKVVQTAGAFDPNAAAVSPINGGVTIDHAVRLFEGWVAYDWHPCWGSKGCGPDCPDGSYKYTPTVTFIAGKQKPFFGLEEILGSGNEHMVEYSMADWFFDADDDNLLMAVGTRIKAMDDRLYVVALVTNGNESQFPNTQMDQLPGLNLGFWYDFGGSWDPEKKKWNLFGDYLADLDYSCKPVFRLGGAANLVPMGRRSLYGDLEQSRVFVTSPGPGGTRLINVLNGDAASPNGAHAVDQFDSYSYEAFAAFKYRGFSIWNDWWFRDLNNFRTTPNGLGNIVYSDTLGPGGATRNALFPSNHALLDYGTAIGVGYFVIPKKLELVGRFSMVRGNSGDINGKGTFTSVVVPGVTGSSPGGRVDVVNGAFRQYHEAREFSAGFNYYIHGQLLKWQTDVSLYDGGNPAGGGSSPAGFIAGTDGWLLRTQIQLAF